MLLVKVFLVWMLNAVYGWKCPSDVDIQRIYAKSGEQAVLSFQTKIKSYHQQILYSVASFDQNNLYSALFYENLLRKERTYFGSEFIGDANTGNFTVKTASVIKQDGGTYMLQYKEGASNMTTEECAMLYIIDKPKKATVYHEKINIEGNNTTLTCTSISTTYPTNHTLGLTYSWKIDNVNNPSNQRYVYSSNRKTIFIKSVDKEDANMSLTCSATEFGDEVIGYTSDESEKSLFVVIYGPDKCEINTTSPYIIMEGDTTETIKCKANCYPSCACVWRNESSGSSIGENGSFVIRTVSKYQTGNYTCTCANTAKDKIATEQTSSLYIKVEYIDFFIKGKEGQTEITLDEYTAGANFICVVDTYWESTVQILFEDKVIQQQFDTGITSFTYKSMNCLHSGMYVCNGGNNHGGTFSGSIRIFVRCSPHSNQQIKQNFTSEMYIPSTLSFTTIAYPEPGPTGFIWHKEKGMLWEKLLSNTDIQISSSLLQSNLTIWNVTASDYGHYRVTVTNEIDSFTQHLFLVEKDNSKRSPIAADNACTDTCHTWMIVGIIFGLLSAVLSGYAVYVTILLRRTNIRKGEGESAGTTDPAYYEKVEEDSKTAGNRREPGCSNTDEYENSVKMYTDLVRYSKDDKQTYDIIQSNK
ncbi:uncharacterized protein LOC132718853 [Ruditapes philippinarum]|uniref:uncharacterized protein LOC132718853 n=1 Tax=Ruditapes philippinarum TaxID=129788 RepID=UPI00295B770B|nr:uncharacterized protein LOC132718853 [Ruditapes philippinarum]